MRVQLLDPEASHLVGFAKKKLRQLKELREKTGQAIWSKQITVGDFQIYLETAAWGDKIRLSGGLVADLFIHSIVNKIHTIYGYALKPDKIFVVVRTDGQSLIAEETGVLKEDYPDQEVWVQLRAHLFGKARVGAGFPWASSLSTQGAVGDNLTTNKKKGAKNTWNWATPPTISGSNWIGINTFPVGEKEFRYAAPYYQPSPSGFARMFVRDVSPAGVSEFIEVINFGFFSYQAISSGTLKMPTANFESRVDISTVAPNTAYFRVLAEHSHYTEDMGANKRPYEWWTLREDELGYWFFFEGSASGDRIVTRLNRYVTGSELTGFVETDYAGGGRFTTFYLHYVSAGSPLTSGDFITVDVLSQFSLQATRQSIGQETYAYMVDAYVTGVDTFGPQLLIAVYEKDSYGDDLNNANLGIYRRTEGAWQPVYVVPENRKFIAGADIVFSQDGKYALFLEGDRGPSNSATLNVVLLDTTTGVAKNINRTTGFLASMTGVPFVWPWVMSTELKG